MSRANSTADRAIEILLMFSDEHPTITASSVAEHFGMPRSTTYRYLSSLRSLGLIVDAEESTFRLGPRIFELARVARRGYSILKLAEPELMKLREATGETVLMTQLGGAGISVLECLEGPGPMRISYSRGHVLPTPATATAKVLLAFGEPRVMHTLLKRRRFDKYTDRTIVDPKQIEQELRQVRQQGYAINRDEVDSGVSAVAAPIATNGGAVKHAVSLAMPSFRMTDEKLPSYVNEVKRTADAISTTLLEYDV